MPEHCTVYSGMRQSVNCDAGAIETGTGAGQRMCTTDMDEHLPAREGSPSGDWQIKQQRLRVKAYLKTACEYDHGDD